MINRKKRNDAFKLVKVDWPKKSGHKWRGVPIEDLNKEEKEEMKVYIQKQMDNPYARINPAMFL